MLPAVELTQGMKVVPDAPFLKRLWVVVFQVPAPPLPAVVPLASQCMDAEVAMVKLVAVSKTAPAPDAVVQFTAFDKA